MQFLLGNIGGASRGKPQTRGSADNFHVISDTWQINNDSNTTGLGLFDNLKRNDSHTQESSLISDVLLQDLKSRNQPPTSVSFVGQTASQYGQENMNNIGSLIDRPQSAAPNMSRPHAPPGLEPNFSSTSTLNNMFHSEDVMKIGVRRPASTGVIGQVNTSTSVMETLGLMSSTDTQQRSSVEINTGTKKTYMDLIREDIAKSPSPEFNEKFGHVSTTDQPNSIHSTKPFSSHTMNYSQPNGISTANNRADNSYQYYQNHHQQSTEKYENMDKIRAIPNEMQNTSLGINNSNNPDENYHQFNKKPLSVST